MIFVSSPYSSKKRTDVLYRYGVAAKYTANLVAEGKIAFSPIVYGHELLKYAEMPSDWPFWKNFCEVFIQKSEEVHVLMMPGWEKSAGVQAEISYAKELNLPIKFIVHNE